MSVPSHLASIADDNHINLKVAAALLKRLGWRIETFDNARAMLERDVDNLAAYFGQFAPELRDTAYGKEIWALYESGKLQPESVLTGIFAVEAGPADVVEVMQVIEAARREEAARQAGRADAAAGAD